MNTYRVFHYTDKKWVPLGVIKGPDVEYAQKRLTKTLWKAALTWDNSRHVTPEVIEQLSREGKNTEWYEGPGVYIGNKLFLSDAQCEEGSDTVQMDDEIWTINLGRYRR